MCAKSIARQNWFTQAVYSRMDILHDEENRFGWQESRIVLLPALLILMASSFNAYAAEDIYGGLKGKMVQDGFSGREVASAFKPPPPIMFGLVSQTMKIREGQANYDHFLAPSEIAARGGS